jgi:hypothetical protein
MSPSAIVSRQPRRSVKAGIPPRLPRPWCSNRDFRIAGFAGEGDPGVGDEDEEDPT